MSGLVAIAKNRKAKSIARALEEAINPLGTMDVKSAGSDDVLLITAQHSVAPMAEKCCIDDASFSAVLAGDVIDHKSLDWDAIHDDLVSGSNSSLRSLRGAFSLALFDKTRRLLFVVTDPFAWQSVYASTNGNSVVVSTSIPAFAVACPNAPKINDDWVYETIFFNYGILATTPLTGVERLPAASVSCFDLENDTVRQYSYRDDLGVPAVRLRQHEAVHEALDVFHAVVPNYLPHGYSTTVSLSAGLDCRAVLASLPRESLPELGSFTFGIPSTSEILESNSIAAQLGLRHHPVYLDGEFVQALPALARDTVFLTGGQQNINRSHLLHVYRSLNYEGMPFALMLTGVSGDHVFRDHMRGYGNIPHIVPEDMAAQFRIGRHGINRELYGRILGGGLARFEGRIEYVLDELANRYGGYSDPFAYYRYLMYEAGPRYFGGQLALANQFTTFRSPYWDPDIAQLGVRLQDATPGFSEMMARKDPFAEARIQASVVAASHKLRNIPYRGMPIRVFARGNKFAYHLHRGYRKLKAVAANHRMAYGENWRHWYRTALSSEIDLLLGDQCRLREYVGGDFIRQSIAAADVHWLGKLATAELTLRYLENGWQRLNDEDLE